MGDDLAIDPAHLAEPELRRLVSRLLNLVEDLQAEVTRLREENQRLRDDLARLQGRPARPTFPARRSPPAPADHSSEHERRTPTPRRRRHTLEQVVVHRIETVEVDRACLPADAQCKGYVELTVQDAVVRAENTRFRRAKWDTPATRQTILGPLPPGYHGQVGPGVRALVVALGDGSHVSQAQIAAFLGDVGLGISAGQVAHLLVQGQDAFHAEAQAIGAAGLASSPWQPLDDTATPVGGVLQHCHVLGNPLYSRYQTTPPQDRLTVLDVLRNGRPRQYRGDAAARTALATVPLAAATRRGLTKLPAEAVRDEAALTRLLAAQVPRLSRADGTRVREALALAAARAPDAPDRVRLLVWDDAPQFVGVTEALQVCWIHEGRHSQKLDPQVAYHRTLLTRFRRRFWRYYRHLLAYREAPDPAAARRLRRAFDRLFATRTGYAALDRRLALTRGHKTALLQVLDHPEVPLHNNPADLAVRRRVRKRKVSYGPQSAAGVAAWDTCQTIAATASKLGVSFSAYLQDRLTQTHALPALADLIAERAATLDLGASWHHQPPSPDL